MSRILRSGQKATDTTLDDECRERGWRRPVASGNHSPRTSRSRLTGSSQDIPVDRARALSELEVLQGLSRAFGSSSDPDEAAAAAVRWIRAAVGTEDTDVRLYLVDRAGALYSLIPRIEAAEPPERRAAHREILDRRRPVRAPAARERTMVTYPLMSRGETVGLLEVVAPTEAVDRRWATLEAVASQVAIVFRNLHHRTTLSASFEALKDMSDLAGDMVRARTPAEAVRVAVRFCHARFGTPAAGWLAQGGPAHLTLVSARGLGSGRGAEIRARMRRLDAGQVGSVQARQRLAERFAELAGTRSADAVYGGDALLLIAGSDQETAPFRLVEDLLEDVLDHLSVVSAAERRTEHLDLGLALTAHEVRAPLVGALATLERVLLEGADGEDHQALLDRSRLQLQQLTGLVDGMLRWAVRGEPLTLVDVDLMDVVRDAVAASIRDTSQDRVGITGPKAVTVPSDPDHLRVAVANVVRNALVYSPVQTKVGVSVKTRGGRAVVTVRDRGPGVPSSERDSIFDPFIRGAAGHLARTGNGLGLFVARRVLEAHHGRIWLDPSRTGATFHLELPLTDAERG
jgi:signal transduction histidine kinase